ncbi:glycerophosphoryl diester phosphodiesterase [Archangium gephyra]|uniref:Glycerophosphoryl diester phosphodiesterase n=1 Tax=Archangium gephyra TaxID=48 RepID=A0AAC8Q751_9BACT|nr:glycerophosphodiester phosphodiesterase [Archangium gephyra]AKJ01989.1 Glycerophosphoryl diester phosphodiesterase [Archangium gephyra]REG34795.1 glycerophosphoryl diester phosphodiesterase [Archangium gephyra]
MTTTRWNRRGGALTCALLLATGCGLVDAPGKPRVVGHRSGAGNYPENSRSAVIAALHAGYPAIEVDVVLTKDRIPILSHDPWIDAELCTYTLQTGETEARRLPEGSRPLIKDFTLEELQRDYRCGGVGDAATPGAIQVADKYLTFDELLTALKGFPDTVVQLDVKEHPAYTESTEVFADEILGRWNAAALPNHFYVTSTRGELLKTFEARQDVETLLIWPAFAADDSTTLVGLANELKRTVGAQELIQLTRDAGADGIAVAYPVSDRAALEAVRKAGLKTAVWTPNTEAQLASYCRWPLDYLITDYVERAPCR